MKAGLLLLTFTLSSVVVFAGPEHLIKQRAKDIRDQNNAAQGVPPKPVTTPSPQPGSPAARPTTQVVTSPAQQSLNRFNLDLSNIKQGAALDSVQKQKMATNLTGAAAGNKPADATVDRFLTSVHKALSAKPLSGTARAKLVQDIDAILNPTKYPQAKMDAIFEDIRSIFLANGSPSVEAGDIAATARVMAADVRK